MGSEGVSGGGRPSQPQVANAPHSSLGREGEQKASLMLGDQRQMMCGGGWEPGVHRGGGRQLPLSRWGKDKECCP